ncbi:MAG: hypothetical protein A2600_07280 [Candidatus Lambdaproteobacteria bacterium RIFOXYD1_FULL_56_27]|uniref:Uncharacterized protein n=1 Tax=Candidatus Lambdaproteobacteria bacterium RIFOXYD2_FULL_56_26 TaxID=1817773 RepID=A0A1F6GQ61_9PROT|nr:MAG: hypothetical protein A2557_05940 [Candidatus Lambdaproteobacteria bacterium RIFOXYD2_FULL_56_26]OGH03734.1 MAG: hypothetical protein A2426_00730 [Candidatus Lambdaproteobacteria bacterium RIFOXYC1_FULL_56_13]OGH07318.1 MAG: hypothetical protein A2600_07280 [Candidatus Lambdaproteobacteria bacterium RIFOXYD1_FULL_56_27]
MKNLRFGSLGLKLFLVLVLLVAVNLLAALVPLRLDITQDRLYTLATGTKAIVGRLEEPVTLKFYFSKNAGSVPLAYKTYGKRVEELLTEYQRQNPGKLALEIYDPKPDSDEEAQADKLGLTGADLGNGTRFYLGLSAQTKEKQLSLPILDPRREAYLEYDVSELIQRLAQKAQRKLGLIAGLPVMGLPQDQMAMLQGQEPQTPWVVFSELQKTFEIVPLKPEQPVPAEVDLLVVVHPKGLSDKATYEIEQFALTGKVLVVLVDAYARMDRTAQMLARMGQPVQGGSDLPKLFAHWGVSYKPNQVLGDFGHATPVSAGAGPIPYPLWHSLDVSSLNKELVATKNLEKMLLVEPGGFQMAAQSPLKLTPLITSSTQAALVDVALLAFQGPDQIAEQLKPDGQTYEMAGILTGELTSAFEAPPASADPAAPKAGEGLKKSLKPARVLLVTDVDFLHDRFTVDAFSLMGQMMIQPKNDNLGFFVNLMEFLSGAPELMDIRSRGRFSRPFERFDRLAELASADYRGAEQRLNQKLQEVQGKLNELNAGQGGSGLSPEQLGQIKSFQEVEKQTRAELREIRKLLRQDIDREKTWLTLANLLAVPLLLVGFAAWVYRSRFRPR